MVASLSAHDEGTQLDLLTEYTMPLGPVGWWIERRWIDREPHSVANREVDRLVALVLCPRPHLRHRGKAVGPDGRVLGLDGQVEEAQAAFLDREVPGWSSDGYAGSAARRRSLRPARENRCFWFTAAWATPPTGHH